MEREGTNKGGDQLRCLLSQIVAISMQVLSLLTAAIRGKACLAIARMPDWPLLQDSLTLPLTLNTINQSIQDSLEKLSQVRSIEIYTS